MKNTKENYWNYEQIGHPKRCPKCVAAEMMNAEFSSLTVLSQPFHQRWYWECEACGYQELGGIHDHKPVKANVEI